MMCSDPIHEDSALEKLPNGSDNNLTMTLTKTSRRLGFICLILKASFNLRMMGWRSLKTCPLVQGDNYLGTVAWMRFVSPVDTVY